MLGCESFILTVESLALEMDMGGLFLVGPLLRWLAQLRYPKLFLVIAGLFVVDLAIPNLVPWDDILLGMGTLMLARWKDRSKAARPEPIRPNATRR